MPHDAPSLRLDGKVAIVTGAGQGIGRGIALVYARAGAKVAFAEWKPHRLQRTVDEICAEGGETLAVAVDVSKHDEVRAMADRCAAYSGASTCG